MIKKLLSYFKQLSQPAVTLPLAQQARLEFIGQKISSHCNADIAHDRIVVVDVETSGLSLIDDHLIAIGAIAIHAGRIVYADSFDVLLRQDVASDKANILVHGIGGTAQRSGLPPEEALLAFLEYLDGAPLFAFHVAFDETMLRKSCRKFLGFDFRHSWVDLAYLLPEIFPQQRKKCHALDDWLARFSIINDERHNALSDALATAQLGLMVLHGAKIKGMMSFKTLQQMEKSQRWLSAVRY